MVAADVQPAALRELDFAVFGGGILRERVQGKVELRHEHRTAVDGLERVRLAAAIADPAALAEDAGATPPCVGRRRRHDRDRTREGQARDARQRVGDDRALGLELRLVRHVLPGTAAAAPEDGAHRIGARRARDEQLAYLGPREALALLGQTDAHPIARRGERHEHDAAVARACDAFAARCEAIDVELELDGRSPSPVCWHPPPTAAGKGE
jgi:hypothetical protein